MTLLIAFQTSGYRTFKDFYEYVLVYHHRDFPDLVSYDRGLLNCRLTPGHVADRSVVEKMTGGLFGTLLGDMGYISQNLFESLLARGLKLVTPVRSNMKSRLMALEEKSCCENVH